MCRLWRCPQSSSREVGWSARAATASPDCVIVAFWEHRRGRFYCSTNQHFKAVSAAHTAARSRLKCTASQHRPPLHASYIYSYLYSSGPIALKAPTAPPRPTRKRNLLDKQGILDIRQIKDIQTQIVRIGDEKPL